jgi:large subunit ribosomal protein L9
MKVILRDDITELGKAGETVEVKDGYGRNYLIPRNLAIPASKGNLKAVGEITKQKDLREKKSRRSAEIVKERIEKLSISVEMLVGEEDRLFGSVTGNDIAELLEKEGVLIDKRMVELKEPIKSLGVYTVPIRVEKAVTAELKLWVIKKA